MPRAYTTAGPEAIANLVETQGALDNLRLTNRVQPETESQGRPPKPPLLEERRSLVAMPALMAALGFRERNYYSLYVRNTSQK